MKLHRLWLLLALVYCNISAVALSATFRLRTSDTTGGNVSDGGIYAEGTLVTVFATPHQYYRFTGWSGDLSDTTNPQTVLMDRDKSVTANFARITYTLTLNEGPGGSVTGGGIYNTNTGAQIRAFPDPGYWFSSWSGDFSGTSVVSTVLMNHDKTITPNFVRLRYALFVNANPVVGGRVTGAGVYLAGTTAEITATPNPGYRFIGWRGALSSSLFSDTVLMDSRKTVIADFVPIIYTLTVNVSPGGSATGSGNYMSGTNAYIRATPSEGYRFTGWSGDHSEELLSDAVLMDRNKIVYANFEPDVFTLNASAGSGGSVSGSGTYLPDTTATLTATPDPGFRFTGWSGDIFGGVSPVNVLMNSNKNAIASFELVLYNLTIHAGSGGTVTPGGLYPANTIVLVQATSLPGYHFVNWSGDSGNSSESINILMDDHKSLVALFAAKLDQTIQFINPGHRNIGDAPFDLNVWATSGLPVILTLAEGDVELDGQTVTINGPSSVILQADQSGDNFFNPAPTVTIVFSVANPSKMTLTPGGAEIRLNTVNGSRGLSTFILAD